MVTDAQARGRATPPPTADPVHIRAFWDAVVRPGDVHEVRVPRTRRGPAGLWGVASGNFNDSDAFVAAVQRLTGADCDGVYSTEPRRPGTAGPRQ